MLTRKIGMAFFIGCCTGLASEVAIANPDPPRKVIHLLLTSSDIRQQRTAFEEFTRHPKDFVRAIRDDIGSYRKKKFGIKQLNTVLYLAAYTKDTSLAPEILAVLDMYPTPEERESQLGCIYRCPTEFALTIYGAFTKWSFPAKYAERREPISADVVHDIEGVRGIELKREHASKYTEGIAEVNERYERISKESDTSLLILAGPENTDNALRFAAARELEFRTTTSEHLDVLYWLAITGEEFEESSGDASDMYRYAIYDAIFRAEKAKQEGK